MRANFIRNQDVIFKRPAKTTFVALVICGVGCVCHTVAAKRTAERAGHANLAHALAAGRIAIKPASPLARWFVERAAPPAKAGISRMARSSSSSAYPIPVLVRI